MYSVEFGNFIRRHIKVICPFSSGVVLETRSQILLDNQNHTAIQEKLFTFSIPLNLDYGQDKHPQRSAVVLYRSADLKCAADCRGAHVLFGLNLPLPSQAVTTKCDERSAVSFVEF